MAKELKSRSGKSVIRVDFGSHRKEQDVEILGPTDGDVYENEKNVIDSLTKDHSFESTNWDSELIENVKKKLKDKDKYYESYEEFLKSKDKDGLYIEEHEGGGYTVHVYAATPQEAMDKLKDAGLLSEEEAELFKSRFDDLEARGIDVSQIHGGDLSVLRDDELFEEFANMVVEAQEKGEPLAVYDRNRVAASMKQRQLEGNVSRETINTGPDVQVGKSLSDEELLAKLAEIEVEAGLSGPDVQVGKSIDIDMEY